MSSRPRPILLDMPLHIKKNIVYHVELKSRFSLRGCSKQLRNIVDTIPIVYHQISLFKEHFRNAENIDVIWTLIVTTDSAWLHVRARKDSSDEEDPLDRLLRALKVIFENRKAHFVNVYIGTLNLKSQTVLTTLNHKMSVKRLEIQNDVSQVEIMSVLPCFKPGVLKKLTLSLEEDVVLDQVFELEQWKQAKSIKLYAGNMPNNIIQHVLHLQEFKLDKITHLTLEDARKIVDSALKMGDEFGSFKINSNTSLALVEQHFGRESFFDIPESNHKLKLVCTSRVFYLEKLNPPQN